MTINPGFDNSVFDKPIDTDNQRVKWMWHYTIGLKENAPCEGKT